MKKLSTFFILMAMALATFADPDSFTVSVSGGNVFTISRSDASAAGWVEYYTQSGSAVAGIHYEDVAGRLDFAAGEYSKIVTVPLYSVASVDKFNLESGISRLFYFCIHNNSMANTPRATGWWDDATVISASDISTTRQQKIADDIELRGNNNTKPYSEEYKCSSSIGDAFSGKEKDYYALSDQTLSYDFNVQMTYDTRYDNYTVMEGVGVTLDGYSSEIGSIKTNISSAYYPYSWNETYTPSGLRKNLSNNTFYNYYFTGNNRYQTLSFPNENSKLNPDYQTHYSNGWFVDMDPTKHVGFIITTQHAELSNIVANVRVKDDFAPVITGISANVNRIYTSGERLYVAVHFNEPVTGNVSGASVSIGSRSFSFNYACGLNTNTLVFYSDLTTTAASGITGTVKVTGINGTVTDACGNAASVSSISANNSVPNFRMYPTYAVSLNPNGGTIIDGNFGRYTYSVGATLPTNIEKTGHNFEGWYANESLTGSPVAEIYPTDMGNKTFYAKWSPQNFKVTLVGNGAELSSDIDVTTHVYGTALQLPVLEKPGYTFYGWYANAELTGEPVYSIGATDMGDKTFYAKWTTNTYYIAYNPAGADDSEAMPNSACTYDAESPLAANTYTRTGYEFLGWATAAQASSITYTDGQSVKNLTDVNNEVVELFAVWKPNTYTVTFSQGEPTTLGTASIEATYDAPLQVVICPDSVGYAFGGYFTEENGGGVQYYTYEGKSAVARYKNTSDITLYAFWTVRDYVISFNNNGGTITTDDYATSYHYGTEVTLPAIEKDGCTFGGWFANVNCTGTAVTKIASSEYGDKTFYAKWNPITYDITLHENGGTIITGNVANYTFGVGAVLPSYSNMERDGHMFAGWYDNELCEGDAVSMVSVAEFGDKEFWAKWEENGYFVTLHTNGGTINSGNVVLYKYGKRTELPSNVTKTGYDFAGWYDNSSFIGSAFTEITATDLGDKQFWARWKEQDYPITFHTNGGTINNVVVDSYTYTVGVVLPADVTQRGYLFRGWYDNEQRTGNPVTLISTTEFGEREFWADWSVVDYDITLNYNGGTIGDDDVPATYRIGSEITLPVPTREGYTFGGWYTNSAYVGEAVQAISSTEIGNKEFWAKWNVNSYTVTLEANGGTINSGNVANYTYGYGIPLPSDVTKTGYTFDGWYADKDCATARVTRISESKTGNLTFYANWNVNSYIVTLETNGGVINSGNVERYTYGKGATLPTNITRDGYTFGGWYTNSSYLGSSVQSISSTEIGDKAFYANWLVNSYSITFEPNGGTINNGNVKNYIYGTTVILPSDVTKTGFTFDGWYDNAEFEGERVAMISSVELGNKAFYANWIVNTYNVTLVTNEGTIAEEQNIERYEYGKGATLPTDVTKEGYTFAGWY
ncbi:MAG: InlB B-repeat-containing protein, partial [Bacteroidales bacterium]|nr:InlB B-repeat-containing protein [Bacteroidales bacterium]